MNFDNLLFEVNQLMNDIKTTSCLHLHESSIIVSNCDKKINQINFIVKFLSGISYAKNDSHSKIIWNFQSSQYNPFSFLSLLKMLYSRNRRSFFTNRKWFSKLMTSFLYSNTTIKYNSYEHNSYIIKLVQSLSRIFVFVHLKNKLKFNFFNEKNKFEDFKSSYNYYSRQYLDYLFSESIYFIPQHLSNHFAKFKLIKCGFKWELFINLVDSLNSNHLYNQIPLKHQLNNLLIRFKDTSSYLYQDSILNNDDSVSMKILIESPLEKIISSYSSCMTAYPHQVTDNVFLNVINTFISTMELYSSLQPIPTSVQAMSIHYDHIDLVQNSFNQINESLHSYKIKILSNDSLYTTGCQTIKSTFLKIKDLRNSLHNDLVQLDDLVAALKNEFNKSGKIFFKLSLLINNLNQIDPNSFDILTSSNQLITFSIDGHEIYLKYIQYYEQIKNLYRKSMENFKILLQNSSTLIDWKLIILQWNQLKLDYFTITDNFSLFISNYTEIFDWIQSFQNVYQSLQASLLKYQKEESDDLSGHNHDDRYRYRRNDLRKKHWDLSFLRWITLKIQPKINLQSINLLNVSIDILSFKRYSLQLKLNNQFKKTFPSISEVHLLNLHHERLINFGKIVETTLKDFIESTERTHFNYYLSDCLIDSSICYLSSLEDDFNVYEKFFVIFSTAINKMEKDKKLNKLQAQNLLGKLNELKESVQNLLISMWNRLRIIKANIHISVQNFNITMNASYYLWNIYRNHTIFNMKSVNFQSYLLNCSHLLSYNQMFASSLDQLPEIPNSIDYSLSFNKIISVSNTLNRNINDKLNTQKALLDHQGLLSTKYQNISVELGEVSEWCTNNIKESIKFNFLTMGNQEIVNFRLLLIGIKVSILEYLNKLASVNTNLIEITFDNTRNLYDCDDLVKLYFQVKYQLNYALKSIEIVLFILEFSDQINSKVQLFKNNLEKLQRNFHSYLGSLRDFNGETFIQQSFNSFLVSIIEEHVNFLETFSEFKIYFNGSLYFNTKILDKMFYDYISLFKSIQMQLISLVVTWKKQKIHTINNPNDLMDEIMLKYVQTLVISSTVILKNSSIRHNYLHVILKYLLNLLESFKINFLIVNSLNLNTLNCLIQTVNSFYEFSNNSQLLTSNYILSNQNTLFNYYFNLFINGSYMQSLGQFDVFKNENIQLIDSIDNYTNFIKTKRINQKGKSASLFKLPVESLDMNGFISSKSAIYLNIEISLINFKEFINSISDFYRKLFEKNKNLTDWLLTVDQSIKEIKTQILSDSLECTTSCLNAINKLQLELFISPNHQSSLVDLSVGSFFSSLHLHNFKKMAYKHKYSNWKRSFKTSLSYPIGYQYNKLVRMNSKLLTMYENIESSNSINQNYLNNKSFKWAKFRNQAQQIVDRDLSRLVAYWRSNSTVDRKASLYEFYEILQSVKIKVNNLEVEQIFNWLNRDLLVDLDDFLDVIKRCVDVNVPSLKNLDDLPDNLKIESAIDRAIKSCTCETRFEIIKVNDCKYKFGSSFQIRLIRILSNTVMVRVGGGWEELMKFLSKVDPCRCGASSTLKLKPTFDKISTVQNTILNESMKAVDSVNSTTKGTPKKSSSLRPSVLLSHSFSQKNLSEADSAIKKTEYTTNTTPTSSKSVQSLNKDLGSVKMVTKTVGSASSTQKK